MKKFSALIIILVAVIFSGCQNGKKKAKTDLKFSHYVQAFTSGIISTDATITVHLAKPVQNLDISGRKVF